jgi:hypothetical protein
MTMSVEPSSKILVSNTVSRVTGATANETP